MIDRFFIKMKAEKLHAKLLINGFEAISHLTGSSTTAESPVMMWLSPGDNNLTLEIYSLDGISPIEGNLEVQVFLHDNLFDTATPLDTYVTYKLAEDDSFNAGVTYTKKIKFSVKHDIASRVWSDASPIVALSHQDKVEILGVIEKLRQSLVSEDFAKSIELLKYKLFEDARVEKKSNEFALKNCREMFEMLEGKEPMVGERLELDETVFDIVGNGLIVHVKDSNGFHAVSLKQGQYGVAIPVYVAKIQKRWVIVR